MGQKDKLINFDITIDGNYYKSISCPIIQLEETCRRLARSWYNSPKTRIIYKEGSHTLFAIHDKMRHYVNSEYRTDVDRLVFILHFSKPIDDNPSYIKFWSMFGNTISAMYSMTGSVDWDEDLSLFF